MYAARDRIIDALLVYVQLSSKGEVPGVSWLVCSIKAEQDRLGITDLDRARMMMIIFWATNANAYKICFWVLTYIIFDKNLLTTIRNETNRAFRNDSLDVHHLEDDCPRLEELYLEILRVGSAAASIRTTVEPIVIGGKTLRKGVRILMPYRQLHFNEEAFGRNTNHFYPARFAEKPDLRHHPSYRPFGGGTTYCPGRFIAKREVFAFVAFVLNRFEIELAATSPNSGDGNSAPSVPQTFPSMDESTPNTGVLGPCKGCEVFITLKKPAP